MSADWTLVSNLPVHLPAVPATQVGEWFVYGRGVQHGAQEFLYDVDAGRCLSGETGVWTTSFQIRDDGLHVVVNPMNRTPVYIAKDSRARLFVVTDDLLAGFAALNSATGLVQPLALAVTSRGATRYDADAQQIRMIPYCTETFISDSRQPVAHVARTLDPIAQWIQSPAPQKTTDFGRLQIARLREAVARLVSNNRPVAALVSGGVDSGLVAAALSETKEALRLYTLATPWGDEVAHARELAIVLGRELNVIHLTANDITSAIADAIRCLGHCDVQKVNIALALNALYRSRAVEEDLLVTGYGADIINYGSALHGQSDQDLVHSVAEAVNKGRAGGEFSGATARSCGYQLEHPYWSPGVLEPALRTPAAVRFTGGREKGHLRRAAEEVLPSEIAWRTKSAIHQGTGISPAIGRLIRTAVGHDVSCAVAYREVLRQAAAAVCMSPNEPLDGRELYEGAIANVRLVHH